MQRLAHSVVSAVCPFLLFSTFILAALLAPSLVFAVDVTASDGEFTDRVQISWTKDEAAANYTVYRCTSADLETCQSIGKRDTTQSRELSDYDAQPLVNYQYRVTVCTFVLCTAISEADSGYRGSIQVDDFGDSCNDATSVGENSSTIGSLETAGDKDYFRIDVIVPGELTVATIGGTNTAGVLKDSACSDISSSSSGGEGSNFRISERLPPGTYYVEVSGVSSATGDYQLGSRFSPNDDYGNSCNDARRIGANAQRDGSLEVIGDLDYFRIELVSGGTLTLSSAGSTDTYGTLKDANCSTIAENDNDAGEPNFLISAVVTPGIYFLEVKGFGQSTGDYQVNTAFVAEDDYGDFCAEAANLGINASLDGVLETEGDQDVFLISIPQRGSLQLMTSGGTDTYGVLMNSNCEALFENDDSGENLNFLIDVDLTPGNYYIMTRGYGNVATGAYQIFSTFEAASDTGGSCQSARTISVGGTILDELETEGDEDYFRIEIEESGTIQIRSNGELDLFGGLRNANCEVLLENDDDGPGLNFLIETPVDPGTYYVSARAYATGTGYYNIQSQLIPPDDFAGNCAEAAGVGLESITDGLIGSAGDHDFFRFELESDSVMFMQTSGTTDTYAVLRNADCGFMRRNDDGGAGTNARIATWLPAGVYYLEINGYANTATGPYQLLLSALDDGFGVDLTLNMGLNDAWFNPDTAGQGFFVTIFPETNLIFVSWFTHESFFPDDGVQYDFGDSGHRWYTALGTIYGNEAFLNIELTSGGRLNSDDPVDQQYVGNLYVRFDNCSSGWINYDLPEQGVSGWIPVQRAVLDGEKVCEFLGHYIGDWVIGQDEAPVVTAQSPKPSGDPVEPVVQQQDQTQDHPLTQMNYGLNDAWYNPEWIGQGFFVTVFPDLGGIFVSWFTFDSTPPDAQTPFHIGVPGHRWFTAFGHFEGNRADMDLELTENGIFNDPTPVQQGSRGTMSIEFSDCRNAKITYYIEQTGESGEIDIVRVLEDPFNMFECENPLVFSNPAQ